MSVSGIAAYLQYGKQSNFTTAVAAGSCDRNFGLDQKITSFESDETITLLGDIGTALVQKYAYGPYKATLGVEAKLSNHYWIDAILGDSVTTGSGPYTHTHDDSETVNAFTAEIGIDTTTNRVIRLERGTIDTATLSLDTEGVATIRTNWNFGAAEDDAETSLDASVATDGQTTAYTLTSARLENPSGTPLAEVQSMELTMNPNIKHVREISVTGAGKSVNAYKGRLDLTGTFTLSVVNNTWWNLVRDRAEPSNNTLELDFTNSGAGTAERSIRFILTGLGFGQHRHTIDQYELVTEEIPFRARDLQVIAVNNTSAVP